MTHYKDNAVKKKRIDESCEFGKGSKSTRTEIAGLEDADKRRYETHMHVCMYACSKCCAQINRLALCRSVSDVRRRPDVSLTGTQICSDMLKMDVIIRRKKQSCMVLRQDVRRTCAGELARRVRTE